MAVPSFEPLYVLNTTTRWKNIIMLQLPTLPEPTEIEIETTNYCNARCVACPRNKLMAPKGYMDEQVFSVLLEKYSHML